MPDVSERPVAESSATPAAAPIPYVEFVAMVALLMALPIYPSGGLLGQRKIETIVADIKEYH